MAHHASRPNGTAHVLDLRRARLGGIHLFAANDPLPGVTDCVRCVVCGGDCAPGSNALCDSCRGLAATFAAVSAKEQQ